MSRDSWRRHHWDKVIELSPRRLGVRLRDALMIHQASGARAAKIKTAAPARTGRGRVLSAELTRRYLFAIALPRKLGLPSRGG